MENSACDTMQKPEFRSALRMKLGRLWFGFRRKLLWLRMKRYFAAERSAQPLPYLRFSHATVLLRQLKGADMRLQRNKITNLELAAARLNGIVVHPGQVFSYWKLIGRPSARKGYLAGMVLVNGAVRAGTGGGLCQLSNLIFWMTLHTPLTVVERHRHGYDVFPDSNRTQPFGSGATCFYPYGDLMIRNDTADDYQLRVAVGETHLEGEWRASAPAEERYEIAERNHEMRGEYWGGYSRHNELWQLRYDLGGRLLEERLAVKNDAIMMYSPFLEETSAAEP